MPQQVGEATEASPRTVQRDALTVFGRAVPSGQKLHFWTKVGELNDGSNNKNKSEYA